MNESPTKQSAADAAPCLDGTASPTILTDGIFHLDADQLPAIPGAYVLLIELAVPLTVCLPGRPPAVLPAGGYLYCGSARGPGGIRARVARHMRACKPVRWHVDQLTKAGRVRGAWVFPGGDECALVAALDELPAPLPGFGSSDCRRCTSHLLALPGAGRPRQ